MEWEGEGANEFVVDAGVYVCSVPYAVPQGGTNLRPVLIVGCSSR